MRTLEPEDKMDVSSIWFDLKTHIVKAVVVKLQEKETGINAFVCSCSSFSHKHKEEQKQCCRQKRKKKKKEILPGIGMANSKPYILCWTCNYVQFEK